MSDGSEYDYVGAMVERGWNDELNRLAEENDAALERYELKQGIIYGVCMFVAFLIMCASLWLVTLL